MLKHPHPNKILIIVAHPDDAEACCGGTIAKLALAGMSVSLVICTNGDRGSHDRRLGPTDLTGLRRMEQEEAQRILGIQEVLWLGYRDGELAHASDLRDRIIRVIRQNRPDILLTFDPWKHYEFHPDHRAVGFCATEARMLADIPWIYPELTLEGIEPWHTGEMYLFAPEHPNYWVDISSTLDGKIQSRLAHRSQNDFIHCDADRESFALQIRVWASQAGRQTGCDYTEAFHKVDQTHLAISPNPDYPVSCF